MVKALQALYGVAERHNAEVIDARLRFASSDPHGTRVVSLTHADALPGREWANAVRHGVILACDFRHLAPEDQEALWGGPPPEPRPGENFARLPIPGCVTPFDIVNSMQW